MTQRIRYNKTRQGVLQSRRMYTTGSGQEVTVELDLNSKRFRVMDSVTGVEVAAGGNTKNISVLKIQAKRALKGLGVSFADESRDRAPKLPTGTNTTV